MDRILIRGGRVLSGSIPISGAKNAALPLMAAGLLSDGPLTLTNAPDLADVATMAGLLGHHGLTVSRDTSARSITISGTATDLEAPYDLVRKMRASVLVLGPLLARHGRARVSLPGGCAIGTRPVDLHLKALEQMGAEIEITAGYIEARAPGGLKGARIIFPQVSVGATENILMAAALARGQSEIMNAAREPEITDLAACLMRMGARIEGIGTDRLVVEGVASLGAATHPIIADRIEAGTFACAAAITGGSLRLQGARLDHLGAVTRTLREAGVDVAEEEGGLRAEGASMITETIFENRFMHVPELSRMGARINFHGASAIVRGVKHLSGAPVMATDLRASVSLILAGLAAEGETIVNRVYHLDRGYERVEAKLAAVGADIERLAGR